MTTPAWLMLAAFGSSVFLVIWVEWRNRPVFAARRERLRSRGAMPLETWHDRYFAPEGLSYTASVEVARRLAEALGCEPTNLRASDSFSGELGLPGLWKLGLDDDPELVEGVEEVFLWIGPAERQLDRAARKRLKALEKQLPDVRTVGDLVRYCDAVLTKKAREQGLADDAIGLPD